MTTDAARADLARFLSRPSRRLLLLPQQTNTSEQKEAQPGSSSSGDAVTGSQPLQLDDVIAKDVLEPLQAAIQARNFNRALLLFDPQWTANYPEIRDQLRALFNNYSVLLFRYKLLQLNPEDGGASGICEVDLDATPADDTLLPIRRSTQLHLQLKQTPKGWKIVGYKPSDFFAQ